ncbi:hypothetical protein [[Eubacterium] cellulosolvens]
MAKALSLIKPSRSTLSKLWYLIHLSSKYDLNLNSLYEGFLKASTQKLRTCGHLTIEYRGESDDSLLFLLTDQTGKTEGQLQIPQIMLKESTILELLNRHPISKYQNDHYKEFLNQLLKTK